MLKNNIKLYNNELEYFSLTYNLLYIIFYQLKKYNFNHTHLTTHKIS